MRVAIPSNDQSHIAAHTGRCSGFVIFDLENHQSNWVEYRKNTAKRHVDHSAAHQPDIFWQPDVDEEEKGVDGLGFAGWGKQAEQGSKQGAGQHNHKAMLQNLADCQTMVALGMGPKLLNDLEQAGVAVYFTRDRDIERVVASLASGDFVSSPEGSACKHPDHHHD